MNDNEFNNKCSKLTTIEDNKKESARGAPIVSFEVLFPQSSKNSRDTSEIKALFKEINHKIDRLMEKIDLLDRKIDKIYNKMLNNFDLILKKLSDIRIAITATDHNLISNNVPVDEIEKVDSKF